MRRSEGGEWPDERDCVEQEEQQKQTEPPRDTDRLLSNCCNEIKMFWNDAWRSGHQRGSSQNKPLTGCAGLNLNAVVEYEYNADSPAIKIGSSFQSTQSYRNLAAPNEPVQCSVFPVTTYQCTQIYEPWRRRPPLSLLSKSMTQQSQASSQPIILYPGDGHHSSPKP
ncbi:unnamed protein product [Leuciscus chuanchicus]